MKVLFNASTLVKGGALQVAVAFIRHALENRCGIEWHFALSKQITKELSESEFIELGSCATIFEISPARARSARRKLKDLEAARGSDVVFTLFGPAYVKFKGVHVCGVADGWVTHSSRMAFQALGSVSDAAQMFLTIIYKSFWYKKASVWIVEAQNAKQGLIKRLRIAPQAIHVVPNTCSQFYRSRQADPRPPRDGQKVRLLCLSAYYRSKNLEIIPEVARHILALNNRLSFEFVLTLPGDDCGFEKIVSKARSLGVEEYIQNIGPIRVSEGPAVYESCHIAFLPSLLETFSANYPEAMAMKRPIVTTDLAFARDVCKDAALYYQPTNPKSAAETILRLVNDPLVWNQLLVNGSRVLAELPTPEERFSRYVEILKACHAEKLH